MTETFEAQYSIGSYTLYDNLLALDFLYQEKTSPYAFMVLDLWGVYYLEFTHVLNYEVSNVIR